MAVREGTGLARGKGLTQDELLRTAVRVIRQRGYRDTSLQDIADEFHFTKPALYYYIRHKEELLYRIYDEAINRWIAHLEDIESAAVSAAEKLREVLRYFLDLCINHDEMVIFFSEKSNLSPEHYAMISEKEREVVRRIRRIYESGVQSGEFRALDPTAVTFALLGIGAWTSHWFSPQGTLSQEELARLYMDMLEHGIAPGHREEPPKALRGMAPPESVAPRPAHHGAEDSGWNGG